MDASPEKVRVAVQDGLPLVRIGLQRIFEEDAGISLLGAVDELHELPSLCAAGADVAIFQLNADTPDAVTALVPACRAAQPGVRLIGMHLGRRSDHADQARSLGIDLLSYAAKPAEIVAVTKRAAARAVDVDVDLVTAEAGSETEGLHQRARALTAEEVEVLRLAAEGLPCSAAASRLGLDVDEVLRLAEGARTLLGADSLRAAVLRGRQAGLVPSSRTGH